MKPTALLLSYIVVFSCPVLAADDWQIIATASPNATFTVDIGNIQRRDNNVYFWEKLIYKKPETRDAVSAKWIKEKRVHRLINCVEKTQGYTEGFTYGENESFISSISLDEIKIKMSPIPPDTVAAKEYALVCERELAE